MGAFVVKSITFIKLFYFIFFCYSINLSATTKHIDIQQQRNLIILNNQNHEHVASSSFAGTHSLLSALDQKSTPILVATCVWRNFVERKQEFAMRSMIASTQEYKLLKHHNDVLSRLDYWTEFFKKQTANFSDVKLLVAEQINEEFCNKDALLKLQNDKLAKAPNSDDLFLGLLFYLFEFNQDDWEVYRVTDFYYLVIPKKYNENCYKDCTFEKNVHGYTQKELALGLKVDHLEQITEPLDSSLVSFEPSKRPEFEFIKALYDLFITFDDDLDNQYFYDWVIFLAGHGLNMHSLYPNNPETLELIANLSIPEFKSLLSFLNNKIKTGIFMYTSCYGAGKHLKEPYTTDGKADCYNFPIIINNVSDTVSYTYGIYLAFVPTVKDGKFSFDYYTLNPETKNWKMKLEFPINWKKFFNRVNSYNKDTDIDKLCSKQIWEFLGPLYIETLPNIRLRGADSFMLYQPDTITKISHLLVGLKGSFGQDLVIENKNNILLETTAVTLKLVIQGDAGSEFPRIVSVVPGKAAHYLEKLDASQYHGIDLLKGFWPLHSSKFNKTFVIKELICANDPDSPEAMIIDAKAEKISLFNVIISIEEDYLVRIFFQNEQGKSFSCYGRYIKDQESPSMGALVAMNEKVVANYLKHFETTKKEALEIYENSQIQKNLDKALKQLAVVTLQSENSKVEAAK